MTFVSLSDPFVSHKYFHEERPAVVLKKQRQRCLGKKEEKINGIELS